MTQKRQKMLAPQTPPISIRLTATTIERIEKIAKARGMSRHAIIVEAVRTYSYSHSQQIKSSPAA